MWAGLLRVASAVVAASLLAGAASAESTGKTIKFIPEADLRSLDPIWTTAYITRNHGYMVYDTLFALDEHLKPQPQMVDTWKLSDDKLTYTFTLRDGLKFHDGTPVRSTDCIASLARWMKRDGLGQAMAQKLWGPRQRSGTVVVVRKPIEVPHDPS
jgi:peptide/nickel transport system substrate-binding protein